MYELLNWIAVFLVCAGLCVVVVSLWALMFGWPHSLWGVLMLGSVLGAMIAIAHKTGRQ